MRVGIFAVQQVGRQRSFGLQAREGLGLALQAHAEAVAALVDRRRARDLGAGADFRASFGIQLEQTAQRHRALGFQPQLARQLGAHVQRQHGVGAGRGVAVGFLAPDAARQGERLERPGHLGACRGLAVQPQRAFRLAGGAGARAAYAHLDVGERLQHGFAADALPLSSSPCWPAPRNRCWPWHRLRRTGGRRYRRRKGGSIARCRRRPAAGRSILRPCRPATGCAAGRRRPGATRRRPGLACSASCARCKASSCVCVLRMATPFSSAVRLGRMVSRPAKRSRSMAVYSCHCGMPATSLAVGGVPCCFAHWASRWLYSASVDCCGGRRIRRDAAYAGLRGSASRP